MSGKPSDKDGKRSNYVPPDPNENPDITNGDKESTGEKSKSDTSKDLSRDSDYQIELSQQEQNKQGVSEISSSLKTSTTLQANKASEHEPTLGDLQPSKFRRGTNKRRHLLTGAGTVSIQDEIFQALPKDKQLVIVVNNLSDGLERYCVSHTRTIRDQGKDTRTLLENLLDTIMDLTDEVKGLKEDFNTEQNKNRKLETIVTNLSNKIEEQKVTIKGLIQGKVSLTDTTGIQEKLKDVIKETLKDLSNTVVEQGSRSVTTTQSILTNRKEVIKELSDTVIVQSERNVKVTQSVGSSTTQLSGRMVSLQGKILNKVTNPEDQPQMQNEQRQINAISSGTAISTDVVIEEVNIMSHPNTNYNPTQTNNFLDPKEVPAKGPKSGSQSYASKTKKNLPQVPVRGATQKVPYHHSHNNRGTFDENGNKNGNNNKSNEPQMVRKDYPDFNDQGRTQYVPTGNRRNLPTKAKEEQQVENRSR